MSAVIGRRPVPTDTPTLASELAQFALRFALGDAPQQVIDHAKLCVLDSCGIALASTTYEFAHMAAAGVQQLADVPGSSTVIGHSFKLPLRDALLLNGILVHGLDFDDTHSGSIIHCTASAWPVALGVAQSRGASGADALAAYLVAVEANARIGKPANGAFQKRGHHPTGLIGTFGATLAAGRLQGLDNDQLERAQGIALSMAAGNLEFLGEGDWTKRMHPGWAGVSAVSAASLAHSGFLGPRAAYEGRYGLYNLHLGEGFSDLLEGVADDLGETWETLDVAFKPYPACHFNHAFADAALALRDQYKLTPDQVDSITALIHPSQFGVVCEPEARKRAPQSAYEAQFSLHYVIAATLLRGRFTLDELDPQAFTDPEILRLTQRINYAEDSASAYPTHYSGELIVHTTDGRDLSHRESINRGARENPISPQEVQHKFFANAQRAITEDQARTIRDLVLDLDQLDSLDSLASALQTAEI